jgi:hypothetical protein
MIKIMKNKKYISGFMVLATLAILATAVPVFADSNNTNIQSTKTSAFGNRMGTDRGNMKPGVFGTISAISGNILTVTSTRKVPNGNDPTTETATTTTTTYTVDATNAKITKNNVAGTISSIVVGDTIMAQGTLTGTNLVATTIRDGIMTKGNSENSDKTDKTGQTTSPITGNGQPVVAGTVSSVSGNTLVITNKSNVTYTVDATNAKIVQDQNTITISNIAVGDSVIVQGTVSGNSVTASSVIDQKLASTTTQPQSKGFFGSI